MINFEIGFQVNTSTIKNQLNTIHDDLEKAFTLNPNENGSINKELAQAITSARTLENVLSKATTDKGLSFVQMNAELRKAGTTADKLIGDLVQGGDLFSGSAREALVSFTNANSQVLKLNKNLQEARRVFTQSLKFTLANQGIQAFQNAVQEAIQWVIELNTQLTQIQIVSGKSDYQMANISAQLIERSKALKVAASDYAEAAQIYYQQGLSDQEVIRRADITIKAAQAAGESTKAMSDMLTAIWNTYNMQGDQLENAASVAAKLGAETAIEFRDIAEAMQISASAASQMGVEYNSLASIIATVGSTTRQSASIIGNAYKTIFSNLERLKVDGTTGEVTLKAASQQLEALGIDILDQAGNLKAVDDIIMDIGTSWETMTQKQQVAVAQIAGGTRQYGQFIALFDNFDTYLENLESANMEQGAAALEQQYGIAINSIENKMIQASESWSRAFSNIFEEDYMITFFDVLSDAGDVVGDLIDGFGGIQTIIQIIIGLLATQLPKTLKNGGAYLKDLWDSSDPNRMKNVINRNFDNQLSNAQRMRDRGSLSEAEYQGYVRNIEASRSVALARNSLSKSLDSKNAATRVEAENLAETLQQRQKLVLAANDEEKATLKVLDAQKQIAQNIDETYNKRRNQQKESERAAQQEIELERKKLELEEQLTKERVNRINSGNQQGQANEIFQDLKSGRGAGVTLNTSRLAQSFENESAITSAQKQARDYITKLVNNYSNRLTGNKNAIDISDIELNNLQQQLMSQLNVMNQGGSIQKFLEYYEKFQKTITKKIKIPEISDESIEKIRKEIEKSSKDIEKSQSKITSSMLEMAKAASFDKLDDNAVQNLKKALENLKQEAQNAEIDISSIDNALEVLNTSGTQDINAVEESLSAVGNELQEISNNVEELPGGFRNVANAANDVINSSNQARGQRRLLEEESDAANNPRNPNHPGNRGEDEISETPRLRDHIDEMTDVAGSIGGIIGMGAAATGSLENMWDTLSSGEATLTEITGGLLGLGSTVGGTVFEIKSMTSAAAVLSTSLAGASGLAGAIGKVAGVLGGPIGWAIGAVLAALPLIIKGIDALIETDAERQERLDQAAADAVDNYQTISDEFTQLKNNLEDYDSSLSAINKMIEGTEEWETAVRNLNQQVIELLDLYPQLAQYISNDNGILTISEKGQNKILEEMEKAVNDALVKANYSGLVADNNKVKTAKNNLIAYNQPYHYDTIMQSYNAQTGQTENTLYGQGQNPEIIEDLWETILQKAQENATILYDQEAFAKAMGAQYLNGNSGAQYIDYQGVYYDNQLLFELVQTNLDDIKTIIQDGEANRIKMDQTTSAIGSNIAMALGYGDSSLESGIVSYASQQAENIINADTKAEKTSEQVTKEAQEASEAYIEAVEQALATHSDNLGEPIYQQIAADLMAGSDDLTYATEEQINHVAGILQADNTIEQGYQDNITQAISSFTNSAESLYKDSTEKVKNYLENSDDFENLTLSEQQATVQGLNLAESMGVLDEAMSAFENGTLSEFINELKNNSFDNILSTWNDFIKDLSQGDTIEQADYDKLTSAQQQFFTETEDGIYRLIGSAQGLKRISEGLLNNQFSRERQRQVNKIGSLEKIETQEDYDRLLEGGNNARDRDRIALLSNFDLNEEDQLFINQMREKTFSDQESQQAWTADENARFQEIFKENIGSFSELSQTVDNSKLQLEAFTNQMFLSATTLSQLDLLRQQTGDDQGYYTGLLNLGSNYDNTVNESRNLQTAMVTGSDEQINQAEDSLRGAINIGQASETYDLDADVLEVQAEQLAEQYDLTAEAAANAAIQNQRMNKGVSELADNWADWKKILTGTDKDTEDYAKAVVDTEKALRDLVGVSEDFEFSKDFLESAENLELISEAAEGSEEAINELGVAVAEDFVKNMEGIEKNAFIENDELVGAFDNQFANIISPDEFEGARQTVLDGLGMLREAVANGSIGIGDPISEAMNGTEGDWVNALNEMAYATGMSVQEMKDLLASAGVEAEVTSVWKPQEVQVPKYTTTIDLPEGGIDISKGGTFEYSSVTRQTGVETVDGGIEVAQINMGEENKGKMPTFIGGGGSVAPSATKGSGGGGGGGGKKSTYKKPTPKVRYINRENQIERTQQTSEKLAQVEDQLYGKAKLAAMQKKSDLIVQQVKDYKALYDEAVAYREQDMQDLAATQLGQAVPMQIDAEGNILNQEEMDDYMREWKDRIDAIEDEGAKETEQRAYDISEQAYTYYKEAQEKALEAMKEAVDQLGEWISNEIEKRQYQMEIDIKVSDRQLSLLEFTLEELGSAGWITNWEDGLDNVIDQVDSIMNAGESTIDSTYKLIDLFDKVNNGGLQWSELDQDMKDMFPEDVWREANENGTLTNDILEAIGDNTETLLDYAGQLTEAWVAAWEKIGEAMDSYLEKLERARAPLDTLSGALDTFISIADSRGWDIGRIEEYNKLLDKQTEIRKANLEASQAQYQGTQEALAAMEPVYNDYLEKFENGEITGQQFDVIQEQYYNLVDANADAADQMYSDWDAYVSNLQEKFEIMSEQIWKTWNDKLGNMWNDVLESQEGFDMYKTLQNWYLDDFDKDYGLTTLTNQIEDAMSGITDPSRLKEYDAFMQEIVKKQEEGYNLSQGELDVLNAKFQLMQAQDAYEDARNNKNTMRLTRDASGNYSYVYSSEDTGDAEQQVLDAQKNLHDAEKAFQEESEANWYEYMLTLVGWMKDINWEMYENDEDYRRQIQEQWNQYIQAMNNAAHDVDIALGYTEVSFKDTVLGWITSCESMQEANSFYQDSTNELGNEVHQAWVDMDQKIEDSASLVMDSTNSMEDSMYDLMGTIDDAMGNMMDTADDLAENMGSNMSQMIEDTASWSDGIIEEINAVIAKYKELYEAQTNVMQNHTGETRNYTWNKSKDGTKWWYGDINDPNNKYMRSGWEQIDGKWYFFNDEGYMESGVDINGDGKLWVDNGHYQVDKSGAWIEGTIAEGHTPGDWQDAVDNWNWGANYGDLASGNWSNTNSGGQLSSRPSSGSSSNSSSGSSSSNQDYSQYLPFDDIPEGSDSNFNYDEDGIRIVNPSFNGSHAGGVDNAHWIGNDAEGWFFGTKDKSGRGNQGSYMDGWLKINGKYYHFDEDGWLDTDFNGQDWHDDFPDEENKSAVWRRYAKGGYTGNRGLKGVDSIPAILAPGEYVLNHDDTTKILSAVQLLRGLSSGALTTAANAIAKLANGSIPQTGQTEQIPVQQDVHIEASFPNVSVASEIEDALNNLVNETIQLIGSQNSRRL